MNLKRWSLSRARADAQMWEQVADEYREAIDLMLAELTGVHVEPEHDNGCLNAAVIVGCEALGYPTQEA